MKAIIHSNWKTYRITYPSDGDRLATSMILGGIVYEASLPIRAHRFFEVWPVEGAIPQWAETEDEFIERHKQRMDRLVGFPGRIVEYDQASRPRRPLPHVLRDHTTHTCRRLLRFITFGFVG